MIVGEPVVDCPVIVLLVERRDMGLIDEVDVCWEFGVELDTGL
jgi:hypothetical protein